MSHLQCSAEIFGDYEGVMLEDVTDKFPIKQISNYAISKRVTEMYIMNSHLARLTGTVRCLTPTGLRGKV